MCHLEHLSRGTYGNYQLDDCKMLLSSDLCLLDTAQRQAVLARDMLQHSLHPHFSFVSGQALGHQAHSDKYSSSKRWQTPTSKESVCVLPPNSKHS
jgi:hypothetical protein